MYPAASICFLFFFNFCSQARAKEEREVKKSKLDGRHEYLLGNIADVLNIEYNEVVEHVIEGTQVCCFVLFVFFR